MSGGVVISRQGYNQHKTENAIRVAPVSATCAAQLRSLRADLASYTGPKDLLLRLDGSDAAGLRDSQLMEIWSAALKIGTGDPKARPHSVRAAALRKGRGLDGNRQRRSGCLQAPRIIGDLNDGLSRCKPTGRAQRAQR